MTTENLEKVKSLARDLRDRKEFPRSPRATLAGYVLAARAVDKCRAVLVDWQGEYHSNCPLDQRWLNFAEIDYGDFRLLVASGGPTIRSLRGLRKMRRSVRVPRSLPGTTRNATCVSVICLPSFRNTWRITSINMFHVTASYITGSTCTIWKSNESKISAVATAVLAVF